MIGEFDIQEGFLHKSFFILSSSILPIILLNLVVALMSDAYS